VSSPFACGSRAVSSSDSQPLAAPYWRDLLTGRWAISLRAWILISLLMQWPSYVRNSVPSNLPPTWAVAIGILRILAAGLVLLIADRTYLRRRASEPASLTVVIATWIAAGAAAMAVQWAAFGYLDQPGISPLRWVVSSIAFALRSALCAYYFGLRDYWTGSVTELQASTVRLLALRVAARADLQDIRARVRSIVVDQVMPRVRQLQADLGDASGRMTRDRLERLSQIAATYSQGIVRDASHQVSDLPTARAPHQDIASPRSGPVPRAERRQPLLISVRWSALVIGATIAPLSITAPPDDPLLSVLLEIVVFLGLLGVGAHIQTRISARSRTTRWSVCWMAAAAPVAVGIFAAAGLLPARVIAPAPLVSLAVIAFVLAMLSSSMERHLRGITAQADELERVLGEITEINAGLQEEIASEKRRVALLLHGPVQGRLAAVSLLLKLDVEQVVVDLTAVVDGTVDEGLALPDSLAQLAGRWQGLAVVSLTNDPRVFDAVADDPGLRMWIFDIVEEGINNAVTHGHATRIDVDLAMHDGLVEVSVRDDGVGCGTVAARGLGLSTIGRSPARLTLDDLPLGGSRLSVTIPLSTGGSRG
jgi:signal transduction histidine kinase